MKIKNTKLPSQSWFQKNLKVSDKVFVTYNLTDEINSKEIDIHYTTDPDVIFNMLSDDGAYAQPNQLSLSHYDDVLSGLSQPFSLLLGENQRQSDAWKVLAKALSLETGKPENETLNAPLNRLDTAAIETLADQICQSVLNELPRTSKFDVIWEYGYLVPYLIGLKFTGIHPLKSMPVLSRLAVMIISLCKFKGLRRFGLFRRNKSQEAFLIYTGAMFGQIFGNHADLNKYLRSVAGYCAGKYYDNIADSIADNLPEYTLISRLQKVKDTFLVNQGTGLYKTDEYNHVSICLLLEFMTSFHILIGMSFANIWDAILTFDKEKSGQDNLNDFFTLLTKADQQDKNNQNTLNTDELLNRYLSKNSTTAMIYRVARVPFPEYGIKAGDHICFRIEDASKKVKPQNPRWLNFGPHETCPYTLKANGAREYSSDKKQLDNDDECTNVRHPCFGQFWARSILKIMFLTLKNRDRNIEPLANNVSKLQFPVSLMVKMGDPQ